jgi:ankyrin repeat protein
LSDSLTANRETPLHIAVKENQIDCVKIFLDNKAQVSVLNDKNRTPLHYASYFKVSHEIVQLLLSSGATLEDVDENGATSLLMVYYTLFFFDIYLSYIRLQLKIVLK